MKETFPVLIETHFKESAAVKLKTFENCSAAILKAAGLIADSFKAGGKMLICGNGGSAGDAQHFSAEFVSRLTKDFVRPPLPAIALTTDSSFLTAYANDIEFDGVFERQVEALGKKGDIFFGISTSGSSKNVVRGAKKAKALGLTVISLIGEGGELMTISDCVLSVPSRSTQYIQESHLAIEHVLCAIVERTLYSGKE